MWTTKTASAGGEQANAGEDSQPARGIRKVGDGSSVISALRSALNDSTTSDLVLKVRGTSYHVHRIILSLRSPMFRAMLASGFKEATDGEVIIDTFPPEHFYAVLEWAYTGQANMTASTVLGVLRAADYCQFDDLVQECRQLAIRFVDADNLLSLLRAAIHFGESSVTQACLAFWARSPEAIMTQTSWSKASADTLCTLLGHDEIACSEDVILASTMRWLRRKRLVPSAEAAPPAEGDSASDEGDGERPSGDDPESARNLVSRVLGSIRLGQLSTQCLLDVVKPTIEAHSVLRDLYMSALEFKLDPDRVEFTNDNLHLQPRRNAPQARRAPSATPVAQFGHAHRLPGPARKW
jgi:hypothetical protein